jgi:hypothetical protein
MSSKKKTEKILNRMSKAADQEYDGLNSNSPTLFPGADFNDSYRKVERQNMSDASGKIFVDNLELSRRIMSVDHNKYNVDEDSSSKLLDYIEQNDFNVLDELKMELKMKQKELKQKMKQLVDVNIDDYISEEDYTRSMIYKKKELIAFSNKITYIKLVIDTIERYSSEIKDLEDYEALSAKPYDFSYNFTNQNPSFDAGKLK